MWRIPFQLKGLSLEHNAIVYLHITERIFSNWVHRNRFVIARFFFKET